MTENKLEGFEDFDSLLGGDETEGEFASELDNFLGDDNGGDDLDAGGGGGGGDSELDSFFEDLSTIDDLEVIQDEEPEPAEEIEAEVAAPAAAAAAAPKAKPEKEKKVKKAKAPKVKSEPGFIGKNIRRLFLLAILAAVVYFIYIFLFPNFEIPWPTSEETPPDETQEMIEMPPEEPPPPPKPEPMQQIMPRPTPKQPLVTRPARPTRPKVSRKRAKPPRDKGPGGIFKKPTIGQYKPGPYSIQVATCFFDSCIRTFRDYLALNGRRVTLKSKRATTQALEILTDTAYPERNLAEDMAGRINIEHKLEGHAFVFQDSGLYRISMGAFPDLMRANEVRDELNRNFANNLYFTTRLKDYPYKLRSVLAGSYATRQMAADDLQTLKGMDKKFMGAFVVRR